MVEVVQSRGNPRDEVGDDDGRAEDGGRRKKGVRTTDREIGILNPRLSEKHAFLFFYFFI